MSLENEKPRPKKYLPTYPQPDGEDDEITAMTGSIESYWAEAEKEANIQQPKKENKMLSILKKLKAMLPAAEFIVTGSYALSQYGLRDVKTIHDLDIILVAPEGKTLDVLTALVAGAPTAKSHRIPPGSDLIAIFIMDEVVINIFVQPAFTEPLLVINDIKHATIPHTIAAKKKYCRAKDWIQLRDMSRIFFIQSEFDVALNTKQDQILNGLY